MLSRVFNTETANVIGFDDGSNIPKTYAEAKRHVHWEGWWSAMCVEFDNMEVKKVWIIVDKSKVHKGRKIIGNRWVLADER